MKKTSLIILFLISTSLSYGQQNSIAYYEAKIFLKNVLKTLEPERKYRNDDSICRVFVPKDTLVMRLKFIDSPCSFNNSLTINSLSYKNYNYSIDSSCVRQNEKNIFYFRVKTDLCRNYDPNSKAFLFEWFKIYFDGTKCWLIPGYHWSDVCIDFDWAIIPCPYNYYSILLNKNLSPWDLRYKHILESLGKSTEITEKIIFDNKTEYEVCNQLGVTILKGVGRKINLKSLNKNMIYVYRTKEDSWTPIIIK